MIGSSLITPFFPPFAIDKGLTQSILGYIISANPIGSFFASLALGKLITQVLIPCIDRIIDSSSS
jgi:MFS family permease